MLYDTVGPALLATLSAGQFIETLELHTTFVRPATTGRLIGRGNVIAVSGESAELDGTLEDSTGEVVATATATANHRAHLSDQNGGALQLPWCEAMD